MLQKILVVEDDTDIRELIVMILESDNFLVTGLDNGHDVLKSIQAERPDVILLDVLLGDMNGLDICRGLKGDPETSAIPVMIVSATHSHNHAAAPDCGANDFLGKPFNITDLLNKVKVLSA